MLLNTAVSSISHAVAKALVIAEKCLRTRLAARPPALYGEYATREGGGGKEKEAAAL